jgi:chromosome segregation ATPase
MELPKQLKDEIWEYCRVNDIPNIDEFITKVLRQGFTAEKFGPTPWDKPAEIIEKEVEKIVEKEVIKEVPVEVIKEVEKIVEKEVEVEVIKEVEVIREVKVTNNEETNKLLAELESTKNNERIHKKSVYDLSKERKVLKESVKELESELSSLRNNINDIKNESSERGVTIQELNRRISDLTNEISQLKEELEIEKNKPKQEEERDIYGEGKTGTWGSNISDLWSKKKK